MSKKPASPVIRLRRVRHNNLKNFDLDLPLRQLIVITGLSGSGKSSLAFDTLFAEGQRRYIETFSPYARQFFDRMDKPQVDSIEGIPPAIAIEQRNSVKSTRSTVGTMTEICDYMKLLWPQIAQLHCRQCDRLVRKDSPQQIWETVTASATTSDVRAATKQNLDARPLVPPLLGERAGVRADVSTDSARNSSSAAEILITFNLPISEKLSLDESLALINKQGYQRLLLENEILRLEDAIPRLHQLKPVALAIIQDRLKPIPANRPRFIEACEQAYHFGKGKLAIRELETTSSPTQHATRLSAVALAKVGNTLLFSNRLHCATCDLEYREPSPALFSFNHPVGACPACRGFGRIITIDYNLALPDRSKSFAEGVVKPWQTGQSAECQADLMKFCRIRKAPTDVPFQDLPKKWQDWLINGDPDYGKDKQHEWPRAWYGIKGYFRWLESKSYKMHVRVLLSRYRSYKLCPDCHGQRFQPESLLYKVSLTNPATSDSTSPLVNQLVRHSLATADKSQIVNSNITLSAFYQLPIRDALRFVEQLAAQRTLKPNDPLNLVFSEVRSRLGYLNEVGLGYLTLDRPTRSLSGGETERVNLTTCLGTRLVNTLFVLDEPSVGLHPRDTSRLVRILEQLRNAGNTVVVVEHEASVMRAANQIVDIGPGHGAAGGHIAFQGPYAEILKSKDSLTGQYLSGERRIQIPKRRPIKVGTSRCDVPARAAAGGTNYPAVTQRIAPLNAARTAQRAVPTNKVEPPIEMLTVSHATLHNLQDLTVEIPLRRFVCLTGVSGSGKTTLARDILLPLLSSKFNVQSLKSTDTETSESSDDTTESPTPFPEHATRNTQQISGWQSLGRVVLVDQSALGKTPRSNPAVYIGAFDDIREVFAQSELARRRGLGASAFSFNSSQGQCERCRGAGFEKIEMQFLSDIYIRCPECNGRRYRPHILEIKLAANLPATRLSAEASAKADNTLARRSLGEGGQHATQEWSIADLLDATVDEAIDFLLAFPDSRPAQRAVASVKLLQEVGLGYLRLGQPINTLSGGESQRLKLVRHLAEFTQAETADAKPTLFLFDEPTTGLHFDDVRVLLEVFQRLVDAGHSVLIIEHNLDVIKSADWVIDLGPDAGDEGGRLVAAGTPEQIAACKQSHTGQALTEVLLPDRNRRPTP